MKPRKRRQSPTPGAPLTVKDVVSIALPPMIDVDDSMRTTVADIASFCCSPSRWRADEASGRRCSSRRAAECEARLSQCARVTNALALPRRSRARARRRGWTTWGATTLSPPTHTRRLRRNGERGVLVCKVGSADINQRTTSCPVSGGEMPSAPRPCPRAYAALRRRFRFPVLQRRCELLRCSRSSGCLLGTTRRRWQRSSGAAQHDPTSLLARTMPYTFKRSARR